MGQVSSAMPCFGMTDSMHVKLATPAPLRPGDKIRFVSPASTPNREAVEASAELLKGWGFEVDFGVAADEKLTRSPLQI